MQELSGNERERLVKLTEECAEVIKIVQKIQRYDYESRNPFIFNSPTNREELVSEMGHLLVALGILVENGDVDGDAMMRAANEHIRKLKDNRNGYSVFKFEHIIPDEESI